MKVYIDNDGKITFINQDDISRCGSLSFPTGTRVISCGLLSAVNQFSVKKIMLPETIEKIEWGAFSDLPNLTQIKIAFGVKYLPKGVLKNCPKLKSVFLPDTLSKIGESAFEGCKALEYLSIPDSVKRIEFRAFKNCSSLKTVKMPASCDFDTTIFEGCEKLNFII